MPISARMLELQAAMNRYGEETVRNYQILHAFGDGLDVLP